MAAAASMPTEPARSELSPDRERGGNGTGMERGRARGTRRAQVLGRRGCSSRTTRFPSQLHHRFTQALSPARNGAAEGQTHAGAPTGPNRGDDEHPTWDALLQPAEQGGASWSNALLGSGADVEEEPPVFGLLRGVGVPADTSVVQDAR